MELTTLACILAGSLFSHLSLSLEVEDVPPLTSEVWLTPVDSAHAQERILGNASALTVGAGALAAGSGLAWLYNKYKNPSPSSSFASRPSYYTGPSYSTGYPSYRPSYSRPSYTSYRPVSHSSSYRPVVSHPSSYRPAVVRPTSSYRPVGHQLSLPSSVPAIVPQTNIQNPLYQFNGTHFVLANGLKARKLSNYLTGTAGLLGGALLYNKYQEYKNRPSYHTYNNQYYTSSPYSSGYVHPSRPYYTSYPPGSYISHSQTYSNGYKRPTTSIFG